MFLSGSGGAGKSYLVKVIYNAISKTLLYHCKNLELTRISVVNIVGTTTYSDLGIKSGTNLLGLN